VSKKKKCPQIAIPGDIPGTFYSLFEENITKRVYSYEKLPEFTSHINPFFAVADCVRKLPNFFGNLPSEFLNDKGPLSKLSLISRLWKYTTAPDAWENNLYEKRKPSPDRQDPDISGDPSTPTRPSQTRSGGNFRKGGGGGDNNTKAVYKGKGNSSAYQWNSSYRMNVQYESLSDRVSAASSESSDTEPLTEEVPRDFSPVDNQEYVNEWCHNYRSVQNSLTHPPIDIYV
jgi:hypothetical protein